MYGQWSERNQPASIRPGEGREGSDENKASGDREERTEVRTPQQAPRGGAPRLPCLIRVLPWQSCSPKGRPGDAALTLVSSCALHHNRVAQRLSFIDHFGKVFMPTCQEKVQVSERKADGREPSAQRGALCGNSFQASCL